MKIFARQPAIHLRLFKMKKAHFSAHGKFVPVPRVWNNAAMPVVWAVISLYKVAIINIQRAILRRSGKSHKANSQSERPAADAVHAPHTKVRVMTFSSVQLSSVSIWQKGTKGPNGWPGFLQWYEYKLASTSSSVTSARSLAFRLSRFCCEGNPSHGYRTNTPKVF